MKNCIKVLTACIMGFSLMTTLSDIPQKVSALEEPEYYGDLNFDKSVSAADLLQLNRCLSDLDNISSDIAERADLNHDGNVDVFDSVILKNCIINHRWEEINLGEYEESSQYDFISASVSAVDASLPSQEDAKMVIFYVDFPDCKYSYDITAEQVQEIAFGDEDTDDVNYPFDSMSAFYSRSSKGVMKLDGQVFRYTTKENKSAYDTDKVKLAEECYEAFNDSVDFSQYDGDGDGMIDATLFTVPTEAGDENWWPCAGGFGDMEYKIDGVSIGHIITGNAQINSLSDYADFNSSYLHEMGHCMGLPDYYLYSSDDYDGMHGNAGTELMDADAASDFGCFSKLMLGWYRENQISVYDSSAGSQTFELSNAQTDDGNCVIIPCGNLDDRYFSEYFMIEYITEEDNNSYINSYMSYWSIENGIRIYHINAELQEDYWYTYFKYQNGSEYTNNDDDGIRLIRLVNDAEGGNVFKTGDVIDSSISGFNWYASDESESVDSGTVITIGELKDGKYSITISQK